MSNETKILYNINIRGDPNGRNNKNERPERIYNNK